MEVPPPIWLSASLILEHEGKILFLKRSKDLPFAPGEYNLPSGKVEYKENFTDALIREVKEEAGITLERQNLTPIHTINRRQEHCDETWVDVFFIASKWEGEVINGEPEKCDGVEWFNVDDIPENTIGFMKHALKQIYTHKKHYSEYGWADN